MSVTLPTPPRTPRSDSVKSLRIVGQAQDSYGISVDAEGPSRQQSVATLPSLVEDGRGSGHTKVKGKRAVNTALTPTHVDRRFFPRDMRGLLEVHEQGSMLQQGMKDRSNEATSAMENLAGQCENTVKELMHGMQEVLLEIQRQVERPANVDWTLVKTWLAKIDGLQPAAIGLDLELRLDIHKEYMKGWEQRMEEKLIAKIQGMDGSLDRREASQCHELEKLRGEVRAAQDLATIIGENVKQSEAQLSEAFSNQHHALKSDFAQAMQDILRVQEKNRRADMAKVEPLLEEQLTRMLSHHHQNLDASVAKKIENIFQVQQEQGQQIADIEPSVKTQLEKHYASTKTSYEEHHFQIKDIQHVVRNDVGQLFNELSNIQRAMNLDFVADARTVQSALDCTRSREFWTQTEHAALKDTTCQTDEAYFRALKKKEDKKKKMLRAAMMKPVVAAEKPTLPKKAAYNDIEKKKAKMREALIKPKYNVTNYYSSNGWAQLVARSSLFENFTFFVILSNAMWIAVDTDHNDAVVLIDAQPIFIIVENAFCSYFSIELLVRFLAFKTKKRCFKDFWFTFDSILLGGMVVETWILSLILLAMTSGGGSSAEGLGNFSILRMARLVKILRMARMARLLRMIPELVVIMKSIGAAFRSVSFFLLLTLIILYVYAVAFRQMSKESAIGERYFQTVPKAMNNLLLEGMLPLYAPVVNDVSRANAFFWPAMMSFILLASITVMNMLVGVLCEVVRTVADREREAMTVIHVTSELRDVMEAFHDEEKAMKAEASGRRATSKDTSDSSTLRRAFSSIAVLTTEEEGEKDLPEMSKDTFERFLETRAVISTIQECGVDAVALLDSVDLIFEEKVTAQNLLGLRFVDFVEIVLNMRGTNPATVKDVKEQMRLLKISTKDDTAKNYKAMSTQMKGFHGDIVAMLKDLRRAVDSDVGSDLGSMVMMNDIGDLDDDHDDDHGDHDDDQDEGRGSMVSFHTPSEAGISDGISDVENID